MKFDSVIAERKGKVIYKVGDTVVKVFDEEYFSKSGILNEALNQARVEETGLRISNILEVSKVEGKWAITTSYIEGRTLAQIMQEDRANLKKYMEKFVDIQLEMHTKTAPSLNKLKDKMKDRIGATGLDATIRYELSTRLESMPKHTKLCHGDFNPTNIIIGVEGTPYILDWSHATQGNASSDAAITYLYFCLQGDNEAAELYLDLFCKKSDTAKQYVQQWLPIVAASQLSRGKAEEKDFLMKWIDVVDYQ